MSGAPVSLVVPRVLALLALLSARAPQDAKPPPATNPSPDKKPTPDKKAAVAVVDDLEWKKRIDTAVDKGDDYLKKLQGADGGYGVYHFHTERDYVAGPTALALLARIASGENQHEASIERGFDWLRAHPAKLTYEVGLVLMAFEAMAAPFGERMDLDRMSPDDLRKYPFPRKLEPRDRDRLQPMVDRLAHERWKECWSYGGDETATTADASNTQYAVLGLKSASRLGLKVDRRLFADVLEYFLDHQQSHGDKVKYVDLRAAPDGTLHRYTRIAKARGFTYAYGTRDGADLCASRACIGIACIVLSLDELLTKATGAAKEVGRARRADADAAIDDAYAWLDQNWAVDRHPPGNPGFGYYYYYLYALERAGALTSRRFVGEHDWHREGAEELLKRQLADGSWPSGGWDNELVNTCFALLFLRRATVRASVTAGH